MSCYCDDIHPEHPALGFLVTARKRSFGQGNIFIGVCQEFCSWGDAWSGGCLLSGGVPGPRGGLLLGGGLLRRGVCSQGGAWYWGCLLPGGCLVETPPTATAAGGPHPTGMHSCLHFVHNQLNHKQERIQKLGAGKPRNMKSMRPSLQDQLGP